MRRLLVPVAVLVPLALSSLLWADSSMGSRRLPGLQGDGTVLLPNGWRISPVGRPLLLGPGALNMVESPNGRQIAVIHSGAGEPWVALVDVETEQVSGRINLEHAWLGIAYHPTGARLFVSGGETGKIWDIELDQPTEQRRTLSLPEAGFVSGLVVSPDGSALFAGTLDTGKVFRFDLESGTVLSIPTMGRVYGLAISDDGTRLYVSDWLRSRVLVYEAASLKPLEVIPVGPHPNELALSLDERLFVACAADNSVYVVEPKLGRVTERIEVAVHPRAPEGSSPSGLAFSRDGQRLYVAIADNNCIAVVDISERSSSELLGFIPGGWYTSSVRVTGAGKMVALASKGSRPKPNPEGTVISELFASELRFFEEPGERDLKRATAKVIRNTPYRDEGRQVAPPGPESILPRRPGNPCPIRYVIYVVVGSRTYDQVFGDMSQGNGDASLCFYGETVTPNYHKLAREFALLDNFYVNGVGRTDGDNWSMAAYANDYVQKRWSYRLGGPEGASDALGKNPLARPLAGYLWDACRRAGLSYRSYGMFVEEERRGTTVTRRATVPSLESHFCPSYPPYDPEVKDVERLNVWLEELRRFEETGDMPRLQIVHLPHGHTVGKRPGHRTPRALVADNDLALGRLVEAVTRSKFWRSTAIFVVASSAQEGPDHVDAHRSVCLVISPYSRLGATDSTFYTTCSVHRTIGLILGLPPATQYDAAATPMYSLFHAKADLRPYVAVPNRVSTEERNPESHPGDNSGSASSAALE